MAFLSMGLAWTPLDNTWKTSANGNCDKRLCSRDLWITLDKVAQCFTILS